MNTVNVCVAMTNIDINCLFPYIYQKKRKKNNNPLWKLNSAPEGRWTFKPSGPAAPLPGSYSETPVTIHTPLQDACASIPGLLAFFWTIRGPDPHSLGLISKI